MAKDLSNVQKKKEFPPIVKKPDDPEALFRPKKDQVMINKKRREAQKRAEEAYRKAMSEEPKLEVDEDAERTKKMLVQQKQYLKTLVEKEKILNKELVEAEVGEKRPIKMSLKQSKQLIEDTEARIAQLQEEVDAIQ